MSLFHPFNNKRTQSAIDKIIAGERTEELAKEVIAIIEHFSVTGEECESEDMVEPDEESWQMHFDIFKKSLLEYLK
jgi:hypothetical protein